MSSEETALGLDESAKDYELPPLVNILNVEGRGCVASSSGHDTFRYEFRYCGRNG